MANNKPIEDNLTKRGAGRPPGVGNKTTAALKDMILAALDAKGGQKWLEYQMELSPVAMISLIGKVLPKDINATVKGSVIIQASELDERI